MGVRPHRTLVYVEDHPRLFESWAWWCIDCPDARKGYEVKESAQRSAQRHEEATAPQVVTVPERPYETTLDDSGGDLG